jgi:hypothetical protein
MNVAEISRNAWLFLRILNTRLKTGMAACSLEKENPDRALNSPIHY